MGLHPRLPTADKTETPLSVDIVSDIRRLNDLSIKSKKAGMIILGGGVCKHQIANSMLFVRSFCRLGSRSVPTPRRGRPPADAKLLPFPVTAQRRRFLRLHQHGSRVRRVRLGRAAGRGRLVGQDPHRRRERQSLRRRDPRVPARRRRDLGQGALGPPPAREGRRQGAAIDYLLTRERL